MRPRIVTAAAGRRDNYELPVALQQAGLLERHITDFYLPDAIAAFLKRREQLLPARFDAARGRLLRRHHDALPSARVEVSRRLMVRQGMPKVVPALRRRWASDQDPLSLTALRIAQRSEASLLVYAGYGYQAFHREPRDARRRGLVQYHPHIRDSARILRADIDRYPCLDNALAQLAIDERDPTNLPELEIADLVICHSTFTADTCRSLGIDARKIRVIPYGIDPPPSPAATPSGSPSATNQGICRFLFVGSGIHRKGLHHLLLAWEKASLPEAELLIVSRRIDPQIRASFPATDSVHWLQSVTTEELDEVYASADVFVLPSLIEGFGYVYLEAMRHGCFCIGTANTGLPDIATAGSARIVPAADPAALGEALAETRQAHRDGRLQRADAIAQARRFSWSRFHAAVVAAVEPIR